MLLLANNLFLLSSVLFLLASVLTLQLLANVPFYWHLASGLHFLAFSECFALVAFRLCFDFQLFAGVWLLVLILFYFDTFS